MKASIHAPSIVLSVSSGVNSAVGSVPCALLCSADMHAAVLTSSTYALSESVYFIFS